MSVRVINMGVVLDLLNNFHEQLLKTSDELIERLQKEEVNYQEALGMVVEEIQGTAQLLEKTET